jgi:hypothetical protein
MSGLEARRPQRRNIVELREGFGAVHRTIMGADAIAGEAVFEMVAAAALPLGRAASIVDRRIPWPGR